MKSLVSILALFLVVGSLGCSSQNRTVDFEVSPNDLDQAFEQTITASSDSAITQAKRLKDDPLTQIYFSEGPGDFGPVASVASLYTFDFVGSQGSDLWYGNLAFVRVFVLVNSSTGEAALVFSYQRSDGDTTTRTVALMGTFTIDNGKFLATLTNGSSQILLQSYDIAGEELTAVVQMKMLIPNAFGELEENGQFSTLIGFGG